MTTNDAAPREAITEQLDSVLALHKFGEDIVPMAVTERQADAVIAHLWQAADDPAVVEAIGKRLAQGSLFPSEYNTDEAYRKRARELATGVLEAGLTALIGPKPNGGNDATE